MDKYKVILKVDEIRRLANNNHYERALEILKTIDTNKIKIATDLSVFADVYEHNKLYEQALSILEKMYEKARTRRIIYQLAKINAKLGNYNIAEEFYEEFIKIAPKDSNRWILRYKIDRAKKESITKLIPSLEMFKKEDYVEEWAYELAKLYHKIGEKEKCVLECSDIVLWFGDGIIVEKAKLLKAYYDGTEKISMRGNVSETVSFEEALGASLASQVNDTIYKENIVQDEEVQNEEVQNEEVQDSEAGNIVDDMKYDEGVAIVMKDKPFEPQVSNIKIPQDLIVNYENIGRIFKNFMNIESVSVQLHSVFASISKKDSYKHMFISGGLNSGKTYFIKLMTRAFYKVGFIPTAKVALITGDKLNRINLEEKQDKLVGGCVVIQNASKMNAKTVDDIIQMIQIYDDQVVVFFEDNTEELEKFLIDNKQLKRYVVRSIQLPEYDYKDLKGFADNIVEDLECVFDAKAEDKIVDIISNVINNYDLKDRLPILVKTICDAKERLETRMMSEVVTAKSGDELKKDVSTILDEDLRYE